jgi:hypothetical protein
MRIIAHAENSASDPKSSPTHQQKSASDPDVPVARQLSDFRKLTDHFVRATAKAFWQAVEAEVLPGQKNHGKLRR